MTTKIDIQVDTIDLRLGIANVLIALHRSKQIDLAQMLPELDRANGEIKWWLGDDGEHQRSVIGSSLHAMLTGQLRPKWEDPGQPQSAPEAG